MITRYAVLNWDSISIISFLRRAYATRGSVMTERVGTVKRSSTRTARDHCLSAHARGVAVAIAIQIEAAVQADL